MQWRERSFVVGMPHMIPGQLSDVELLKVLGDAQWYSISQILGRPSTSIVNDQGERLYASFISLDLRFSGKTPQDFGEGSTINVVHASRFYSRRFVEGFFCFDDRALTTDVAAGVRTKDELERLDVSWLYVTNAFVTREDSNSKLRTFAPAGGDYDDEHTTDVVPAGIREHEQADRTGRVSLPGVDGCAALEALDSTPILYQIVPESDLNGAGLLYFARYIAIANFGERRFLRAFSRVEVSAPLIRRLTTVRRKICYFANADEGDAVAIRTQVFLGRPDGDGSSVNVSPLQFFFLTELRRQSDGVVMARSAVQKVLRLSRRDKSLVLEAQRIGREVGVRE